MRLMIGEMTAEQFASVAERAKRMSPEELR